MFDAPPSVYLDLNLYLAFLVLRDWKNKSLQITKNFSLRRVLQKKRRSGEIQPLIVLMRNGDLQSSAGRTIIAKIAST